MTFEEFPKIARLSRECVVTEKIDGTNAQVFIERVPGMAAAGDMERTPEGGICVFDSRDPATQGFYVLRAGSRNRWITPESDNFGFASWAYSHCRELVEGLGEGRHYGEWWGSGIQRGYGLKEKRFSLFNVARWGVVRDLTKFPADPPACCHVVPVLYRGVFATAEIELALDKLRQHGSYAAEGFPKPEGVVVWHEAARMLFKKTLEKDAEPKGRSAA